MSRLNKNGIIAKWQVVIDHYRADPNRDRIAAYRKAYPGRKPNSEQSCAHRIFDDPRVRALIRDLDEEDCEYYGVKAERIIQEYARGALADIRHIFDDDGKIKHIKDMPTGLTPVIEKITLGKGGEITEVKLCPKRGFLTDLARILGMFERDNTQKNTSVDDLLGLVNGATRGLPNSKKYES